MTNRVLLDNVDHQHLRVAVRHAAEHGDSVNQMLIFPTEFEEAQREYPILFNRDDAGAFQAVVLLGFERDENLFLDGEGWDAFYVPAIQRRGPFSIGLQRREGEEPEVKVHIDLDDPRVGATGEPLFLPHGGNTPYLTHVTQTLRTLYEGHEAAGPMFAAFETAKLLRPIDLEIGISDERKYRFADYWMIDAGRLAALDGATLEQLNRAGYLRLAMFAAASLGNVARLVDRKRRRV
ncbi:SapC family protein [Sphingomonas soli]|uniref:SapC family protein n=1 Tax=Sphingomonas soli TaxID=266127 RepID=UPI000834F7F4|nr:SapC family protein [Sphingomonas soli]